jgi:hypothetical protein
MVPRRALSRLTMAVAWITTVTSTAAAQQNPKLNAIVSEIKPENLKAYVEKMESYHTRVLTSSDLASDTRGLKAAREWVAETMRGFSPRLVVFEDAYQLKPDGRRILRALRLANVIAVLPGRSDRILIVSGHLDTVAANPETGRVDWNDTDQYMPGPNDDASGVAATMECARVLSQYDFDATIYFVAFSGEEAGLIGSRLLADRAKKMGLPIEGVLNNDMISNVVGGSGIADSTTVRVFADGPRDSSSMTLARYVKRVGEGYVPSLDVRIINRRDRFGRGGDQTPFTVEDYAGVRFTDSKENYAHQHTVAENIEDSDWNYAAKITRVNAAVLADLAWAPPAPTIHAEDGRLMIGRGESRYDAEVSWQPYPDRTDVRFEVLVRDTLSPYWEKTYDAGPSHSFRLEDVSIDDVVLGVRAVDDSGNESLVSTYVMTPREFPPINAVPEPWPEGIVRD